MDNKIYGHYLDGGADFCITEPDIPRNWYNYLWNDDYITFTSQTSAGEGLLQDRLGVRIKLVKDRGFFLSEGNEHWGIGGLPVDEERDAYRCIHRRGVTDLYTEKNGIASTVSILVPRTGTYELWRVRLENKSESERTLRVLAFGGSDFDPPYVRQGYNTDASHFDAKRGILYHAKRMKLTDWKEVGQAVAFMGVTDGCDGYAGTYNAIVGPYGSFAHPAILKKGCCNLAGCGEKLGYAMEKNVTLGAGEVRDIVFVMGIAFSLDEAEAVKDNATSPAFFESERKAVLEKFKTEVDAVSIQTPDEMLNNMFEWLKHQSNLGSRWARVRHNGYRDICSDTDCLACINPEIALERFLRILSYQYSDGYAPRTFIDGQIQKNNFADNTVWLNFTASSIIKELGDLSILEREVPYNDGTVGTVYEHLYRSVDFLYNFKGHHGLVRIWGGDWNDCMNRVGMEGKGVSVWLSIAWVRAAKFFAELATLCGKSADAAAVLARAEEMSALIEEYGWDGEYYIDAIDDRGVKVGSKECEEGKMFLIPQIWAVFSGVSRTGRETVAMDAVEKYLSDPLGTVISSPAYTKWDENIGFMTLKHPGIHENGGVYLHTIAWKIAADAMLGRADRVEEDIKTILPFRNPVVDGRAEPYIMCNSYFGKQTGYRYGTPGQSWRTAAGQWFEKALVNYVFGLLPEVEGLTVKPCLPSSWKTASIDKRFRNTTYHIRYENGGVRIKSIFVNGKPIEGNLLPLTGGEVDVLVITE